MTSPKPLPLCLEEFSQPSGIRAELLPCRSELSQQSLRSLPMPCASVSLMGMTVSMPTAQLHGGAAYRRCCIQRSVGSGWRMPSVGTAWPRSRLILERAIRASHSTGSL